MVTQLGGVFTRCPKSWLQFEASEADDLIRDANRFLAHGVLPVAGGSTDQPPGFWQAVEEIGRQSALIKAAKAERERRADAKES